MPRLSEQDLAEITRLRIALECLAIEELCARKPARATLAPLGAACDEFEQFLRAGYSLAVIEADRRFHEALIDAAAMPRLRTLYLRAPLPINHRQTQDETSCRQVCEATAAEHRALLAALERGDATAAKRILRQHLDKRSLVPIPQYWHDRQHDRPVMMIVRLMPAGASGPTRSAAG